MLCGRRIPPCGREIGRTLPLVFWGGHKLFRERVREGRGEKEEVHKGRKRNGAKRRPQERKQRLLGGQHGGQLLLFITKENDAQKGKRLEERKLRQQYRIGGV